MLGAFDGDRLIGFLSAIPGIRDGRPYWHSHMLAVTTSHRDSGIGTQLKLAQKEHALKRGIRLIEWTFDPLVSRNAYLNIEKLGVIVRRYYPSFYGGESDRLIAEWWLDRPRPSVAGDQRRVTIRGGFRWSPVTRAWECGKSFSQTSKTISTSRRLSVTERPATTSLSGGPLVSISQVELREIRMRLLHPFETSFGVTQDRRILLVKVSDGQLEGYGEVTAGEGPFYCHETVDTAWYILSDFILPRLIGKDIEKPDEFAPLVEGIRGHNMAKGGLEAALWDLEARRQDKPLWKLLGGSREQIECGVSIGIQPTIDRLLEVIQKEVDAGYRRIKIKIKPGWDVEVVRQVRAAFPKILLMCDANSAYTLADIDLFRQMDAFDVMMFEQPLHYEDMIDHAELQRQIRTPICLDESIHSADDARKAINIGACRIINIKLGRVGGHREARAVHDVCREQRHSRLVRRHARIRHRARPQRRAVESGEFFIAGRCCGEQAVLGRGCHRPCSRVVSPEGRITQTIEPGIGYQVKESLLEDVTVRTQVFGT